MMEAASGTSFPLVFFDGERETGLGNVVVSPSSNFKGFQSIITDKIGLSPHQFSIYLTDQKRGGYKIPITGRSNFWAISREGDSCFLVVLKRSRREMRRKGHDTTETTRNRSDPPANVMLLRRDDSHSAINRNILSGLNLGFIGYEKLQKEKERYLMNMGLGFERLSLETWVGNRWMHCEECERAKEKGIDDGFHLCVYDTVTFGFRSPAGPIARPAKSSD